MFYLIKAGEKIKFFSISNSHSERLHDIKDSRFIVLVPLKLDF